MGDDKEYTKIQRLKDKRDIYLRKYELMATAILHQDSNYWTVFSIFLAINGLMLALFITEFDKIDDYGRIGRIGPPSIALLICLLWGLFSVKITMVRNTRITRATRILLEIEKISDIEVGSLEGKSLEVWDRADGKKKCKSQFGFIRFLPANWISIGFIVVMGLIWGIILFTPY